MNKAERNKRIVASTAHPDEVAQQFNVSRSTVYRLKQLAQLTAPAPIAPQRSETFATRAANRKLLFTASGESGLKRQGGRIYEEFLRELRDDGGIKIYTEMATNAVVSAVLFAIQMAQRQVTWFVEPYSDKPKDREAAEYLEECRDDMSQTWDDVISQVYSMLRDGFSLAEIVYKKRLGLSPPAYVEDPARSRFDDGKIGWRRWQFMAPLSLSPGRRWEFNDAGRIVGVRQTPPPDYQERQIPIEKLLLFRTTVEWDNPEGRSILRAMYRDWYYAENLCEIESIGAERLGTGLPVMYLGNDCSLEGAESDRELARDIVTNVRSDDQMGLVIPRPKMGAGAPEGTGMLFELVAPPSQGFVDFDKVITRHEQRMAMTVLAQFIFIGMLKVGTQALNKSATDTFQMSIGAWSEMTADVINRFAVPRLFALNAFDIEDLPRFAHSEVGVPDLPGLAKFVNDLVGAQVLTPDAELEDYLREMSGLPERPERPEEIETPEEPEEPEEPEAEEDEEDIEEEEKKRLHEEASAIIDESFALRLKQGGPTWERRTNAYEMALRRTYQAWADDTAAALEGEDDDDKFNEKLAAAIALLLARLAELGRRHLPEALQLGLGDVPASPAALGEVAAAVMQNEQYLEESLAPAIEAKTLRRVHEDPLIRGDRMALGGIFSTFLGRIGSYAGAFWALIMRGVVDKLRQGKAGPRVRSVLHPRAKHCTQCPQYAKIYPNFEALLAETGGVPGAWNSDCGPGCRCHLEVETKRGWARMSDDVDEEFGGPGSGHHGHKGVPGQRGGSSPGGAGMALSGFEGKAEFEDIGTATGRALGSGDIAFNRDSYEKLSPEAKKYTIAHEIAHNTIEPHILKDMDEWDRAESILLVREMPSGAKLFVGGNMRIGEAVADAVAVTITRDSFGNVSSKKMGQIYKWANGAATRAGFSIDKLGGDTNRIYEQLEASP